jgi:PKD repeat protein
MKVSSGLSILPAKAIALSAAIVAIGVILLAASFITTYAQQQQTQTGQPASNQSPTLLSIKDSFRVQLPQGWVIQDVNNTGFTLAAEALQGYGILAQLCPQEEQQQSALPGADDRNRYTGSCQQAPEEVIHIIRYPNLGSRLGIFSDDDIFTVINRDTIPNAILAYHVQKLQEAGYRDIQILNSADTTINVDISTGQTNNRTATAVPAKLVEMAYSTDFTSNDTRTGYFILTATAATPRNLGTMTGYSIFYEGNSTATTSETGPSISLAPILLPASVRQVFDSFELIAATTVPLTAIITSDDTEGVAPATFEFEAEATGGTEPYTISWDFGDGSSEESDDEDDETVEHTFDVAGTYNVDLTVIDSSGRTASDSMSITVEEPPPLTSVDILSNETEGVAPATFELEANLTGGTEPFTYSWDFGDGSSEESDDETVEHTFDVAGTYNVDLVVIDSTLQTASDSILITVEEPLLSPTPPIPEEELVCDPSYPDLCIPPPPPDLGCDDISDSNFEVLPPDPHGFDGNNDGIGCETGIIQPEPDPEEPDEDEITFDETSPEDDDEFIDNDGA